MNHPSIDTLDEYVADRLKYRIAHGSAAWELEQHLSECDECRLYLQLSSAQRQRRVESGLELLVTALKRDNVAIPNRFRLGKECPAEETLASYIGETLDVDVEETIQKHLDTCPHCASVVYGAWHPPRVNPGVRAVYENVIQSWSIYPLSPKILIIFLLVVSSALGGVIGVIESGRRELISEVNQLRRMYLALIKSTIDGTQKQDSPSQKLNPAKERPPQILVPIDSAFVVDQYWLPFRAYAPKQNESVKGDMIAFRWSKLRDYTGWAIPIDSYQLSIWRTGTKSFEPVKVTYTTEDTIVSIPVSEFLRKDTWYSWSVKPVRDEYFAVLLPESETFAFYLVAE